MRAEAILILALLAHGLKNLVAPVAVDRIVCHLVQYEQRFHSFGSQVATLVVGLRFEIVAKVTYVYVYDTCVRLLTISISISTSLCQLYLPTA